jgi:hypothetical protein
MIEDGRLADRRKGAGHDVPDREIIGKPADREDKAW